MGRAKWSPEHETVKALVAAGMVAEKCTWMIPYRFIKKDLYGFADVAAFNPEKGGMLLVQATTGGHIMERFAKIQENEKAGQWVRSPERELQIWGWDADEAGDLFAACRRVRWSGMVLVMQDLGSVEGVASVR